MIKKYTSYYILSFIVEAFIGVGALWISQLLGNAIYLQYFSPAGSIPAILSIPVWLLVVAALGLPFFLYLNRAHSFPVKASVAELASPTAKAIIQLVVIIIAVSFAFKSQSTSRLGILLFGLISYGLALLKQRLFEFLLARSQPHWGILLMGNSSAALNFIAALKDKWPCGIDIFGLLTDEPSLKSGDMVEGVKVIGRMKIWEKILLQNQIIDEVVIFPNGKVGVSLNEILRLGQELQIKIRMAVGEPEATFNPRETGGLIPVSLDHKAR